MMRRYFATKKFLKNSHPVDFCADCGFITSYCPQEPSTFVIIILYDRREPLSSYKDNNNNKTTFTTHFTTKFTFVVSTTWIQLHPIRERAAQYFVFPPGGQTWQRGTAVESVFWSINTLNPPSRFDNMSHKWLSKCRKWRQWINTAEFDIFCIFPVT
jgi:hypothetical protein